MEYSPADAMARALLVTDENRLPLSGDELPGARFKIERWSNEHLRAFIRRRSNGSVAGGMSRAHLEAVIEGLSSIARIMRERLRLVHLPIFSVPDNLDVEILGVESEAEAIALARLDPHEISSGRQTRRGVIRIRVSPECSFESVRARARHELAHHVLRAIFDHPEWFGLEFPIADWIIAALEDDDDDASLWLSGAEEIWRRLPCRRTVRGNLHDIRDALLVDARRAEWSRIYGAVLAQRLEMICDGGSIEEPVIRQRLVKMIERAIGGRLCAFVRQRADSHEHAASVLSSLLEDFASYDETGHPDPPFGEGDPRRSDTFFRSLVLHQSSQDPAPVRLSMAAHAFDLADRLGHRPAAQPIERLASWTVAFRISEGPTLEIALPRNAAPPLELKTLERALGEKDKFLRRPLERAFAGTEGHMPASVFWARFLAAAGEHELEVSELGAVEGRPVFFVEGAELEVWKKEREVLARRLPRLEAWLPAVAAAGEENNVGPSYQVFSEHLTARGLSEARRRAAEGTIHKALFKKNGAPPSPDVYGTLPANLPRPKDPRYREAVWSLPSDRAPGIVPADLFAVVVRETCGDNGDRKKKYLRTPLVHLLAAVRLGHEEKLR